MTNFKISADYEARSDWHRVPSLLQEDQVNEETRIPSSKLNIRLFLFMFFLLYFSIFYSTIKNVICLDLIGMHTVNTSISILGTNEESCIFSGMKNEVQFNK